MSFFPVGGAISSWGTRTVTYISQASQTADTTSYFFGSQSIGPASNDRVVVVCCNVRNALTTTIAGASIGGIPATVLVSADSGTTSGSSKCYIFAAKVPTGTTADIIIIFDNTCSRCNIHVYTLTGTGGTVTPTTTAANTSTSLYSLNCTVAIPSKAGVVGKIAFDSTGTFPDNIAWSYATENYDGTVEDAYTRTSSASVSNATFSASQVISANTNGSGKTAYRSAMVVAVW